MNLTKVIRLERYHVKASQFSIYIKWSLNDNANMFSENIWTMDIKGLGNWPDSQLKFILYCLRTCRLKTNTCEETIPSGWIALCPFFFVSSRCLLFCKSCFPQVRSKTAPVVGFENTMSLISAIFSKGVCPLYCMNKIWVKYSIWRAWVLGSLAPCWDETTEWRLSSSTCDWFWNKWASIVFLSNVL